jgi:dienelactone hydrolase
MRHNDYFAAGILVCGGGDPSQAEKLVDTPLFVFHGDADDAVPVSGSRDTVQAIKDAGGELVKYVEYPGQGHGIWNNAFAHSGMLEELLTYRLSERYPDKGAEESAPESEAESEAESKTESVEETVSAPAVSAEESTEDEPAISPILLTLSILGFALPACTVIAVLIIARKKQQ